MKKDHFVVLAGKPRNSLFRFRFGPYPKRRAETVQSDLSERFPKARVTIELARSGP